MNKCVAEVKIQCHVGFENGWRAEGPAEVRWHFPGEPPQARLPTGKLGHVARPLQGLQADADGRATLMRSWIADSVISFEQIRNMPLHDHAFTEQLVSPAVLATLDATLAALPPHQRAALHAVFRRVFQLGQANAR